MACTDNILRAPKKLLTLMHEKRSSLVVNWICQNVVFLLTIKSCKRFFQAMGNLPKESDRSFFYDYNVILKDIQHEFSSHVGYQISRKMFARARPKIQFSDLQSGQFFKFSKFFNDPYKIIHE